MAEETDVGGTCIDHEGLLGEPGARVSCHLLSEEYGVREKGTATKYEGVPDDDEEVTEEEEEISLRLKEQCFLLSNIFNIAALKRNLDKTEKELPYVNGNNSSLNVHGDPFGLMNALTQSPHKKTLFEMSNAAISALQPMIRLFKVTLDEENEESEVELKFDSHYRPEDINEFMSNRNVRGHGVGLKSFNFAYEADNPFAIKKSISAKLVLFANSFSELLKERGTGCDKYKYIDLALKTGGAKSFSLDKVNPQNSEVATENLAKLNFRLKAVVGWANPAGSLNRNQLGGVNSSVISTDLLNAIYDSAVTLNLTPTVHDFDIDEFGRVTFTINYLAYVEDFFDQPIFNIFSDPTIAVAQLKRKLTYKTLSDACNEEEISKLINDEEEAETIKQEKQDSMKTLMTNMLAEEKIRFLQIPLEDMLKSYAGGPFEPIDENLLTLGTVTASTDEATVEAAEDDMAVPPEEEEEEESATSSEALSQIETITYFYVSDLIDVILKYVGKSLDALPDEIRSISEEFITDEQLEETVLSYTRYAANFKTFRVLLGPVEILKASEEGKVVDSEIVNLGDMPISAKYFMEWLTTQILKRDQATYPLPTFLNAFFNKLISDFLNKDTCYGNRAKQRVILNQNAITSYRKSADDPDEITQWCQQLGDTRLDIGLVSPKPVLNVMGEREDPRPNPGVGREINYITYFAARTQPSEIMVGDKCEDEKRGIWHYQIGKDTGIVKSINLSKTEATGLAEVRFEQEGYDGLMQLRVLYDASIKTFLDVSAYPGAYIYIEPRGFDPSVEIDLTQFGIGGYHMIVRSEHSLGPGLAETTVSAKWVAEIEAETLHTIETDEETTSSPTKCYTQNSDRASKTTLSGADIDSGMDTAPEEDDGTTGSES